MTPVARRKGNCSSCGLVYVKPSMGTICPTCDPEGRLATSSKEKKVIDYLQAAFPDSKMRHNMKVPDGCSRKRPDALFDAGTHFVAVEIDENQHANYEQSCEHTRMWHIAQDCGLPVVFVRFNPDSTKHLSKHHLALLSEVVTAAMKDPPSNSHLVDVVYLYYTDRIHNIRNPLLLNPETI